MDVAGFVELLGRAYEGETEAVLAAVDAEPGLATRAGDDDLTLLHEACDSNHIELARGLLDRGANVHARWMGLDALMCASSRGNLEVHSAFGPRRRPQLERRRLDCSWAGCSP